MPFTIPPAFLPDPHTVTFFPAWNFCVADEASQPQATLTERLGGGADQVIDLKNPLLAAGLAFVLPGLGHLYQGRLGKAILFMVCILGTYFYGWAISGGKVVYACWNPDSLRHYGYFCQVWVGLPAWPAMIQATVKPPLGPTFMVPPDFTNKNNNLSDWYRNYPGFELGSVLTMVAGLLNLLVIFDAAAGPVGSTTTSEDEAESSKKSSRAAET